MSEHHLYTNIQWNEIKYIHAFPGEHGAEPKFGEGVSILSLYFHSTELIYQTLQTFGYAAHLAIFLIHFFNVYCYFVPLECSERRWKLCYNCQIDWINFCIC